MPRASKVPREFYETPPGFTRCILNEILRRYPDGERPSPASTIVEPASGDRAIIRVLHEYGFHNVFSNDLDPARDALLHYDATGSEFWRVVQGAHWTIMNPPFSLALPMLEGALGVGSNVAMHVRISWEEPTRDRTRKGVVTERGRETFLRENLWNGRIVLPRYKFDPTAKGTDSATTVWLVYIAGQTTEERMSYPRWNLVAPRSLTKETFSIAA